MRWQLQDLLRVFVKQKVEGKKIWETVGPDNRKSWRCAGLASKSLQGRVSEYLHHTQTHTQTSYSSTHRAVWKLHLCSYRIAPGQILEGSHIAMRLQCCRCFLSFTKENEINMLHTDYFTDEACFHLDGYINIPKWRIRSTKNSNVLRRSPYVHREWWTVYVVSQKLNCSHSIDDHSWQWRTREYHNLVRFNVGRGWTLFLLQQSGATSNTMDFFKECFDSRLISKHLWLSRSPHLALIDFFLWSLLEGQVCKRTHWSLSNWRPTSTSISLFLSY